jgi:hypothetical protein
MPAALLSQRLAGVLPSGFFRPLARPSAPVYIDCADHLAQSADEGGQVSHADAQALIREVLAAHPQVPLADDEGAGLADLRQRAGQLFNKMLEAGWIQERHVSLDERWVLLTPHLRRLLRLLRDLATDEVSDLKDFAATLRSICASLLADGALDPTVLSGEEFRQTGKELIDRVERATEQMHAVETLILRQEQRQRVSESAAETLNRFLVEFHAGEHMVCYDALQQGGLQPRLQRARAVVQEALANTFAKQRLAEGLMAHRNLPFTEAYSAAEQMLLQLERGLGSIPSRQRIIDGRMADFSRLSAQRYRYQTEIRGRRPEQVKAAMRQADELHAGSSFAALANEPGLPLLSLQVSLRFGTDSLYRPRKARPPVNLALAESPNGADPANACALIRQRNLYAITPQRAGKFVEARLPEKGAQLSTSDLKLHTEDDLLDFLAALAFERSGGKAALHSVTWRVVSDRDVHGLEPEKIPADNVGQRKVERLIIERIS